MRLACIDFETANSSRSSACQLGAVIVADGKIVDSVSWMIRPTPFEFHSINVSKHGILAEHVQDCPTFDQCWDDIEEFIGDSFLVAHNAAFDMSVLRRTLAAYELEIPPLEYFCTVQVARALWKLPSNSLPFLASHFDIPLQHHDALSDAKACAQVLIAAMNQLSVQRVEDFLDSLQLSPGVLETGWGHMTPYVPVS
ncbi:MAG: 3'-5' exonuclease, partial [Planctomycetaceae bacterium]|nr:3'-5' exonuclease [Planctomycetaceae bacterium]